MKRYLLRLAPVLLRAPILTALLASLLAAEARAGLYGEHKKIGDEAFEKFLEKNAPRRSFFRDTLGMGVIATPRISRGLTGILTKVRSSNAYGITYGDINAISGDHTHDPVEIYYGLLPDTLALFELAADTVCGTGGFSQADISMLQTRLVDAVWLHHQAMEGGEKAASNFAFGLYYVLLSYEDESHFHYVGVSAEEELADLVALRTLATDYRACLFSFRERLIDRLNTVNVAAKYAMLHCAALDMVHTAGIFWNRNRELARTFLLKALLYNGFADHYLQDAFASGHIVVRRHALHALDDNGKHDYYGRVGLFVQNRRGDRWLARGDGYIEPGEETQSYAAEAVTGSLDELWDAFETARSGRGGLSPLERFEDLTPDNLGKTLVAEYRAFQIMPLEIAESDIYMANSRSGTFLFGAVGSGNDFHTPRFWSAGAGFGLKFGAPGPTVLDREYDIWAALKLGYANGGFNAASDAEKWWEWRVGPEGTFFDLIQTGLDGGIRYQEGVARGFLSPSLGLEFKRPGWSFAPALRLNYQIISRRQPAPSLQVELRYY
jgi:hypothetical protein